MYHAQRRCYRRLLLTHACSMLFLLPGHRGCPLRQMSSRCLPCSFIECNALCVFQRQAVTEDDVHAKVFVAQVLAVYARQARSAGRNEIKV